MVQLSSISRLKSEPSRSEAPLTSVMPASLSLRNAYYREVNSRLNDAVREKGYMHISELSKDEVARIGQGVQRDLGVRAV